MKTTQKVLSISILAAAALASGYASKGSAQSRDAEQARVASNLANFDYLDYNVFIGQKWAEFIADGGETARLVANPPKTQAGPR